MNYEEWVDEAIEAGACEEFLDRERETCAKICDRLAETAEAANDTPAPYVVLRQVAHIIRQRITNLP